MSDNRCRYGHERYGECRTCVRATVCRSSWKRRYGVGRVPAGRVQKLAKGQTNAELGELWSHRYGVNTSAGWKAAERLRAAKSLEIVTADRWCVALGEHLSRVFPELYSQPWPEDEESAA